MNDFYVYEYLRSKDSKNGKSGTPYYVGKGKGFRAYKTDGHTVPVPADRSNIVILSDGMSEIDAFQAEILLIHFHGRIDLGTGCLRNMTEGGDGSAGHVTSQETRFKISEANKGRIRSAQVRSAISLVNKKRYESAEARQKLSVALQGRVFTDEHHEKLRIARVGKTLSAEARNRIGEANRLRVVSEETRQKMSESRRAQTRAPHSPETRQKLSEAAKLRGPVSEETRRKLSEASIKHYAKLRTDELPMAA